MLKELKIDETSKILGTFQEFIEHRFNETSKILGTFQEFIEHRFNGKKS